MATISDVATSALNRLEENPASPVFWQLQNEIYPLVLESLCEATLITGSPEFRMSSTPFTIPASTTFLSNPAGAFAILRVELGGLPIRKVSIFDMDMENTGWQNNTPQAIPRHWFPLGLGQWGIEPQLMEPAQAILTVVQFPVTDTPPYTGAEVIPFQSEFMLGIENYVEAWARFKEGGAEADQGMQNYEVFLSVMEELSSFELRRGELRFSKVMGSTAEVSPIQKK